MADGRIVIFGKSGLEKLKKNLERPEKILYQIGIELVATAQKAFKEERLGNIKWPARYPNQDSPKINVAGVVSDLNRGSTVRPNRFVDRPVLKDTGHLRGEITVGKSVTLAGTHIVQVGTNVPYAQYHQFGLQPPAMALGPEFKTRLAKFLRSKQDTPEGKAVRKAFNAELKSAKEAGISEVEIKARRKAFNKKASTGKISNSQYRKKLGFLFQRTTYQVKKLAQRPFFGITPEAERNIKNIILEKIPK